MKCILSHSNDPYFNLATEEYLLKSFSGNYYFQYVNHDAVVIGKHQNTLAEIDVEFLLKKNIRLARRISGGGAVFHDHGNMNYSFITTESPGDYIKFGTYTAPIIEALNKLGVQAYLGKRNEILVGEKKISGTASHVFKRRVLHHGTLLFNTDLEKLSGCLYVDRMRYNDKAVKSVRSEVININTLLKMNMTEKSFYEYMFNYFLKNFSGSKPMEFTAHDLAQIEKLRHEKFETWNWNYGYSPRYEFERDLNIKGAPMKIHIVVNKGEIQEINFTGGIDNQLSLIKEGLVGVAHQQDQISRRLTEMAVDNNYKEKIIRALF